MKTYYECMPCFVNQTLRAIVSVDSSLHETILREVFHELGDIDFSDSPPEMARRIFDVIEKYTGPLDLYEDAKRKSNEYILGMYDELYNLIVESDNPFRTALKLAVAGNIIDFGAKHDFSDDVIHQEVEQVLEADFPENEMDELHSEIDKAEKILYIGDNAGEIVFDRLFIEQIPYEKVIFAVRGRPIINDALLQDAETAGLTDIVKVISNGAGVPGTVLDQCSEEFRKVFSESDLIISKGQGNYETLSETPGNIFFLLKIKCDIVARDLARDIGDFVVLHRRQQSSHN